LRRLHTGDIASIEVASRGHRCSSATVPAPGFLFLSPISIAEREGSIRSRAGGNPKISDVELRRTIQTATNKSEAFNLFVQWVAFGGGRLLAETRAMNNAR
jgi:hypothetical protein